MSYRFNYKKINTIINFIYILLIIFIAYLAFRYVQPIIFPFIISITVSYLAEPMVCTMTHKFKIHQTVASVFCVTSFYLIFCIIIVLLSATIIDSVKFIYESVPDYMANIDKYFEDLNSKNISGIISPIENLIYKLFEYVKGIDVASFISGSFGSKVFNSFSEIMLSIPYVFMTLIITFVSSIFISSSFVQIKEFIILQFPDKKRNYIIELKKSIIQILKKYLKSYATLMLITFSELTVLFIIFNISPAATIAFIISVVDLLPVLGVGTVIIPWALINFIGGDITKGIILLSIYALVTVIRQIIEPKIVGENIGLHPVVTLIAIYVGMKILGVIGLFAVPITIMVIRDLQQKGYISLWKEKNS